jgi:hypothetical protein
MRDRGFRTSNACAAALGLFAVSVVAAQSVPVQDPYAYPQEQPYTYQDQTRPAKPPSARELFAQTLSTVLQGTLSAASMGLTQLLVGKISAWFSRSGDGGGSSASPAAPGHAGFANDAAAGSAVPTGYSYDPNQIVHAGLAYEIHLLTPGGGARAVDPQSHIFATGDRFLLLLRPSLPGWIDVSNIDPAGRERTLDSRKMAGAELLTLGPYEFVDVKGTDVLRLVVSPCATPNLIAQTRSIVRAEPTVEHGQAESGVPISVCADARTRSAVEVKTRTIVAVESDGGTSFALDPLRVAELGSGELQPREVLIALQHR